MKYTLTEEKRAEFLYMRCEDAACSQWSYFITRCTATAWNTYFLNKVPSDKLKHWTITKTSTHLKIVCNNVTVLNFNFATDYSPGFENAHRVWSKRCKYLNLKTGVGDSILVKTIG